ncbi:MarR family transcriptional regulator [Streptomyces sp. 3MP-14]|uniref:MarR family transcriptional regulator n=1 Tax=Streptomyces mimosae TaxID=2586635 RepID=A0A5N6A5X6_9ACTN|nr:MULTISPECIES: MarR family transcriptional regulator [Streptomyces]KAB8163785.1 MarR family transcriptional regulator [Streptomyces mimosae]KAB8175228.1 MarR family transcriptional regulator [Streptomyces sp. 3MP-14]
MSDSEARQDVPSDVPAGTPDQAPEGTGRAEAHPTDAVDELTAQWMRERPDLGDLRAMALIGRINRASSLLVKRMKPVFTAHGLENAEFDVLATLRRAGAPHELTPSELVLSSMVTSGAITNRLDRLERKGLIERHPDPGDRRAVRVRLTEPGLDVVDRAVVAHVANETRMLAALPESEQQWLSDGLRRLLVALGDTHLG